jgi:hypothetical protein
VNEETEAARQRAISGEGLKGSGRSGTTDQPNFWTAGPGPHDGMLLGCAKLGAPQNRGPCSVDHSVHVHRRD